MSGYWVTVARTGEYLEFHDDVTTAIDIMHEWEDHLGEICELVAGDIDLPDREHEQLLVDDAATAEHRGPELMCANGVPLIEHVPDPLNADLLMCTSEHEGVDHAHRWCSRREGWVAPSLG